jgi:Thioredoxin-like
MSQKAGLSRRLVCVALLLAGTAARAQADLGYDPAADPFVQLAEARAVAAERGTPVLVIAGGDWCIWCHYLGAFLKKNVDIETALEETFVVVKAYYGDKADNRHFFATLPEAPGYPHFWIVGADGTVLASQDTLPLEDGDKSYDPGRFRAFIESWRDRGV